MAKILKRKKALSVNPLKASQTIGAALTFLGFNRAIPMLHGSQGCTAFGKVFFVRHFREPIPLQTTAMDQVATIMGPSDNIVEGLRVLCSKHRPALIGVPSTGLAETQGSDVQMGIAEFRNLHPEFGDVPIVGLSAPDWSGCLETGFALAIKAIIESLVPEQSIAGRTRRSRPRQVNVLVGSSLTPGDLEELKELIELFDLRPLVIPDLSDSLDGHLGEGDFSPLTIGGAKVDDLATLSEAAATLVIGASMHTVADLLATKTGVADYRFDHLMGLEAVDTLVAVLADIAGEPVPAKLERQRAQLQDAMLDTHFMLGQTRFAIAADPDLLHALDTLVSGMGGETVAAVAPAAAPVLRQLTCAEVQVGDLEDLEAMARAQDAELLIGNSHCAESALRLGLPLLRAGFPQYDRLGGYQRTWIGYRGSRQTLFELANLILSLEQGEVKPYPSIFTYQPEKDRVLSEEAAHAPTATPAHSRPQH